MINYYNSVIEIHLFNELLHIAKHNAKLAKWHHLMIQMSLKELIL